MKNCPICNKQHKRTRYSVCTACTNWYRRYTMKIKCIQFCGGECIDCGCNKIECLEFHHRNPEQKEFKMNYLFNAGYDKIEQEIKKCDLLCSNCHKKRHYKYRADIIAYYQNNNDYIPIAKIHDNYKPRLSSRKVIRPSKEELERLCKEKTLVEIAKEFGVQPPSVGKWRKCYGLPPLMKGYWVKQNERKAI